MFSFFPSDNKGGYFQKLKNSQDFDLWQVMPEVLKQEMEMMEDVDGNQKSGKLTSWYGKYPIIWYRVWDTSKRWLFGISGFLNHVTVVNVIWYDFFKSWFRYDLIWWWMGTDLDVFHSRNDSLDSIKGHIFRYTFIHDETWSGGLGSWAGDEGAIFSMLELVDQPLKSCVVCIYSCIYTYFWIRIRCILSARWAKYSDIHGWIMDV